MEVDRSLISGGSRASLIMKVGSRYVDLMMWHDERRNRLLLLFKKKKSGGGGGVEEGGGIFWPRH